MSTSPKDILQTLLTGTKDSCPAYISPAQWDIFIQLKAKRASYSGLFESFDFELIFASGSPVIKICSRYKEPFGNRYVLVNDTILTLSSNPIRHAISVFRDRPVYPHPLGSFANLSDSPPSTINTNLIATATMYKLITLLKNVEFEQVIANYFSGVYDIYFLSSELLAVNIEGEVKGSYDPTTKHYKSL